MVAVISLLANPELEAVYIGGTAEAAETENGAVCFHPSDKFGILLPRVWQEYMKRRANLLLISRLLDNSSYYGDLWNSIVGAANLRRALQTWPAECPDVKAARWVSPICKAGR